MSATLDVIGDRVNPTQMVKSGTRRLGQWVESARVGIMGSEGVGGQAGESQGNPLAAGIIAFGVGLLVGSILRPTKVEQQGLSAIADMAEPALDVAIQAASDLGHGLQESTGHAADKVGEVLTDATREIVDLTKDSTSEAPETEAPPPSTN
jgi:hypothetical protein